MKDSKANDTTNEFEVIEVLGVNARMRVNLQSIIVVRRILEETVERIKHLMGEKEEKFSDSLSVLVLP